MIALPVIGMKELIMVQKSKWIKQFFAVLTVLVFLIGISALTAYADEGENSGSVVTDDGNTPDANNNDSADPDSSGDNVGDSAQDPDSGSSSAVDQGGVDSGEGSNDDNNSDNGGNDSGGNDSGGNDSGGTPSVSVPEEIRDQYERIRDYYLDNSEDLQDGISQYIPNENLADLPTVAAAEVEVATAEPLPDVAVSDATLFSGIVMWVCVAVGISVVAGVMVSKRTHRKNG